MTQHVETKLAKSEIEAKKQRERSVRRFICPPLTAHRGIGESTGFDYVRTKNPTRQLVEDAIAAVLENGARGFAFSSGMAAILNHYGFI
ncbi:PLP-dependent transferase [Bacillus velezensis]|uniref:PLP-dependent transferase n=1 Tax=Bacillus velezensis TaxID=492670 RepID=UPI003CF73379